MALMKGMRPENDAAIRNPLIADDPQTKWISGAISGRDGFWMEEEQRKGIASSLF